MSKRALVKYLEPLTKQQLEEQLIDLYSRFKEVKTFYDFVFNPKEERLVDQCKAKIANEYFPTGKRKKAKMRRSVAQKHIKHFQLLGMQPELIADVMLYNIEIAQSYTMEKPVKQLSFYKSMLNSYAEAITFINYHSILPEFKDRILKILNETKAQKWHNVYEFDAALDILE